MPARQLRPATGVLLLLTAACHLDRSPIVPDDAVARAGAPATRSSEVASPASRGTGGVGGALLPVGGEVASAPPVAAGVPAAASGAELAASPASMQPSAAGKSALEPVAGSGGSAAKAMPTPTDAGSAGALAARPRRCVAGPYSGTFEGSVQLAQLSEFSRVSGSLSAELTPDGAEGLVIRKGQLRGTDQEQNTLVAAFTGRFSCITHRLEAGKIEDGTYHLAALDMDVAFTGSVGGTQTDEPASASGSWITASSDGLLRGSGTWSLREGK